MPDKKEYISLLGRLPDDITISPETTVCIQKVETAGFYWQVYRQNGNPLWGLVEPMYFVGIRLKIDMWTVADAMDSNINVAIAKSYSRFIQMLPAVDYIAIG
jgi:hypothetical protein